MDTQETPTTKSPLATRVDPQIFGAVEHIANTEERTISNTIERLLKTHPRVQEILEAGETAAVSA